MNFFSKDLVFGKKNPKNKDSAEGIPSLFRSFSFCLGEAVLSSRTIRKRYLSIYRFLRTFNFDFLEINFLIYVGEGRACASTNP